jgi:hypothetical protein
VILTDKGKRAFEAAMDLQAPWVNKLADGLLAKDIGTVRHVVTALRKKLEGSGRSGEMAHFLEPGMTPRETARAPARLARPTR